MKVIPGIENLRERKCYRAIETAIFEGCKKPSFRLTHFSVQSNHLHLIVEASDTQSLSRGMQGLAIRIARKVNRALERKGKLFLSRYYARSLRTPREVKASLRYVLNNIRRHRRFQHFEPGWIDPCSSGRYFSGWSGRISPPPAKGRWPIATPESWLLKEGWKKCGLIEIDQRPGPSESPAR